MSFHRMFGIPALVWAPKSIEYQCLIFLPLCPLIHVQLRIPEMVQQKLAGQPEFVKKCMEEITVDTKFTTSLKSWHTSTTAPTSTTASTASSADLPPRTLAKPDWRADGPWNFRRQITSLETMPAVDFEPLNPTLGLGKKLILWEGVNMSSFVQVSRKLSKRHPCPGFLAWPAFRISPTSLWLQPGPTTFGSSTGMTRIAPSLQRSSLGSTQGLTLKFPQARYIAHKSSSVVGLERARYSPQKPKCF